MRNSRLEEIIERLRTGQIGVDQLKIAAKFGDADSASLLAQMKVDFTPIISGPNICKAIEECGIKIILVSYMVLEKLFLPWETGWRLRASENLFEEAKIWLKNPTEANKQSEILNDEIDFIEGGIFKLKDNSDLLSESFEVLKLTYEEIPEEEYFKYIASVVIPYILEEVTLDEIQWPQYDPGKAPILKAWDWVCERLFKSFI